VISGQQAIISRHQKQEMLYKKFFLQLSLIFTISLVLLASGCISPSEKTQRPKLLKTENATHFHLLSEVNRFAKVSSMRAKMYLKFEDNSFAESGLAEKYKTVDGEVVVQRPANILLKIQVPVIKTDVVQMSSNGEKFRVAILEDGAGGKYKKFVSGTNNADYSVLQEEVKRADFNGNGQEMKQSVNAFSNLRPQHFTDAMLVRPVDTNNYSYVQSTILQEEEDVTKPKKSPLRKVLRGYYLLDELRKNDDGSLSVTRRFWFDRVGGIRLARQQIFDANMEIESDIVYGKEGNLTTTGEYNNLPLRVEVTRPKEKYKMSLEYQTPDSVSIGKTYPAKAFVLENTWNLQEVDLDQKAKEMRNRAITEKPDNQKENK
jgi:hypothetical protein